MKAWTLDGFGLQHLRMEERPIPKPAANEVLIRIGAVSLNYRDKLVVEGLYNPNVRFPVIQVADAVGEVVDTGKDVRRFHTGDRISLSTRPDGSMASRMGMNPRTPWGVPFPVRSPSTSCWTNRPWFERRSI